MEQQTKPKRNLPSLIVGLILIAFGGYALFSGIRSATDEFTPLLTPNARLTAEVVDTPQLREQGLSGRESIADDRAMLFVFETATDQNCFWMKDMRFAIDMIWLNGAKEVVTVTTGVTPETFPESFCPDEPAMYGVEVGSGRAAELGIEDGSRLEF